MTTQSVDEVFSELLAQAEENRMFLRDNEGNIDSEIFEDMLSNDNALFDYLTKLGDLLQIPTEVSK